VLIRERFGVDEQCLSQTRFLFDPILINGISGLDCAKAWKGDGLRNQLTDNLVPSQSFKAILVSIDAISEAVIYYCQLFIFFCNERWD